MSLISKMSLYARAAIALRSCNLPGLPLLPKSLWSRIPANRASYNEFILWIRELQLSNVRWIVDVGANHGAFSEAASACHPEARVVLVEPLPTLHDELKRKCQRTSGRWQFLPCALGSSRGQAVLHVDPGQDGIGSLVGFSKEYLEANPSAKPKTSHACEVRTLDEVCEANGIPAIDLLKIDVEGFEFEALAGAAKMLPLAKSLIIELSLVRREDITDPFEKLFALLEKAGLQLVAMKPSLYSREEPRLPLEFNILARRR